MVNTVGSVVNGLVKITVLNRVSTLPHSEEVTDIHLYVPTVQLAIRVFIL